MPVTIFTYTLVKKSHRALSIVKENIIATIRQRGSRWQAIIRMHGANSVSTHSTREEAKAWADDETNRIRALIPDGVQRRRGRELYQYRLAAPLSAAQIIAKSMPYPAVRGVYFLIRDGAVAYVGKALNIAARLSRHGCPSGKPFDRYHFVIVPEGEDLLKLENAYIAALQPALDISNNAGEKDGNDS